MNSSAETICVSDEARRVPMRRTTRSARPSAEDQRLSGSRRSKDRPESPAFRRVPPLWRVLKVVSGGSSGRVSLHHRRWSAGPPQVVRGSPDLRVFFEAWPSWNARLKRSMRAVLREGEARPPQRMTAKRERTGSESVALAHEAPFRNRRIVVIRTLRRPIRQLHLGVRQFLVRNHGKQMSDGVQARPPLVI